MAAKLNPPDAPVAAGDIVTVSILGEEVTGVVRRVREVWDGLPPVTVGWQVTAKTDDGGTFGYRIDA